MSNNAMSNETDLDWLARNVHVWPAGDHQPWCYVYWKGGYRAVSGNCITVIQPCVRVEMSQWLARRAELQNKPSWDDFGESAKFMAQDSDGAWMAFESEPAANYHVWSSMRGWCGYAREGRDRCRGEILGDWRDTLEKRPEQTIADICREVTGENRHEEIFEPFVSVLRILVGLLAEACHLKKMQQPPSSHQSRQANTPRQFTAFLLMCTTCCKPGA